MNGSVFESASDYHPQEPIHHDYASEPQETRELSSLLMQTPLALECLLTKTKLSVAFAKEASNFLKKRAELEAEYSKSLIKLVNASQKALPASQVPSTSLDAWSMFCTLHERIGDVKSKLSTEISELADELSTLAKNTERSRKHLKDDIQKHQKNLTESETTLEKAKIKFEMTSGDWERCVLQNELGVDESKPMKKGLTGLTRSLSNPMNMWKQAAAASNPTKLAKLEEENRVKTVLTNQTYKNQLVKANHLRQQYDTVHLPEVVKVRSLFLSSFRLIK